MKSRPWSVSPVEAKAKEETLTPNSAFPVVAIGASAGGLEAYTEFFRALPIDLGMAFVLLQHLDPTHHSLLADIISKTTKMPVEEVRARMRIRPNWVYVIPPNALMAIADGVFTLAPRGKDAGQHLTVNFFMRSLAEERKSRAIGIVLSGTGAMAPWACKTSRRKGASRSPKSPHRQSTMVCRAAPLPQGA